MLCSDHETTNTSRSLRASRFNMDQSASLSSLSALSSQLLKKLYSSYHLSSSHPANTYPALWLFVVPQRERERESRERERERACVCVSQSHALTLTLTRTCDSHSHSRHSHCSLLSKSNISHLTSHISQSHISHKDSD